MRLTGANPLQNRKKQLVKDTLRIIPMAIMKSKAVVKLGLTDAKSKKEVKKALMDIEGFSSLTLDLEKSTLVVTGDIDPIKIVHKLRKFVSADLMTFGPGGGGNVD